MTQKEILRHALIGIKTELDREKAINQLCYIESQRENEIAQRHIAELTEKYNTVKNMLKEIQEAEQKKNSKWYNKIKNKK
jgi:hypothetical protein